MSLNGQWIFRPKPNPAARLRLICVPYAGRGASVYREWPELMGPGVEVCALQLPGRESRLRERPFTRISDALRDAAHALEDFLDIPIALFGHSMGGLFCFELARILRSQHGITPVHLFVSARRAPQLPDLRPPLRHLPDERFVNEICRRYNGIPRAVLHDEELMSLLLPMLRADVELLETYVYQPGLPLACRITALAGREDTETCYEEIAAWEEHTTIGFQTRTIAGDHFFVHSARDQVVETVLQHLGPDISHAGAWPEFAQTDVTSRRQLVMGESG
jgi:medium-chain acyl-[acyl-carrier-protein] hydrolase